MGVTCRASPSHLVFKFACATQHVIDLIPEIDKKELTEKHRERLRARVAEIADTLWPRDSPGEKPSVSKVVTSVDKPPVSDVRWEHETKRANALVNAPALDIADVESKASSALKTAKAKIQKLEAEVARMQTEPQQATVPVNHFRLTRNDDETQYSYEILYADYARGSTSVAISEPYVEKPHQVTNIDTFIRCMTSAEPRLSSITLITLPGKTEAVESYLGKIIRTWATKGIHVHVQHDQDAHARYIKFSTGLRVRGDRCLDIYRRPEKKGMPRLCLPTEIFIERVRLDQGSASSAAVRDAKPRSHSSKRELLLCDLLHRNKQERKRAQTSLVKRSPVKNKSPKKISEDPSPLQIWRERQSARTAVLLDSSQKKLVFRTDDDDIDMQDANVDRERTSMVQEHAAALARERYDGMHDDNWLNNEEIRLASQSLAVWGLHAQHFLGERCAARCVGEMYEDGTIHYDEPPYTVEDERIITSEDLPDDLHVFRVRDEYHQLFIGHYYDGYDDTSAESEDTAESDDPSSE